MIKKSIPVLLAGLVAFTCGPGGDQQELGQVKLVVGQAQRFEAQTKSWQKLELDSPVRLGDSLATGPESRVEIQFGANSINIGEETKICVAETTGGDKKKILQVDNCFGTVVSDIKKLTHGRDAYQVRTPTSVAAIRGTHFCVMFSLSLGYTDVSVLGGRVWVFNRYVAEPVVVLPGFYTTIYFHRAPFAPKHFNYGQWKKFSPLLHPKARTKYHKKYKIKVPRMKGVGGPQGPRIMKGLSPGKGPASAIKKAPLKKGKATTKGNKDKKVKGKRK